MNRMYINWKTVFSFASLWITMSSAQSPDTSWTKVYGSLENDYAREVEQTVDGGYIITGFTFAGATTCDLWLVKTDSMGDTLWTKTYGLASVYEAGRSIDLTTDNGYIIVGTTNPGGLQEDILLVRTDSMGDTLWTKTFGQPGAYQDFAYSVQQTTDGGYIMTGFGGLGPGGNIAPNIYLIKTDTNGNLEWFNTYDADTSWDMAFSVQQTADQGYIIAGIISPFPYDSSDIYLIKTDSLGDTLWTKTYGGLEDEYGEAVIQTSDGGYIVAGGTDSYGGGARDVYVIKTDSLGDSLWTRTFGGIENDVGFSVDETDDGEYIIAGSTRSYGSGLSDMYIIKVNSNGDSLWTSVIGGSGSDGARDIHQTSDQGYIIVGDTGSFGSGSLDMYLVKILPDTMGIRTDNLKPNHGSIMRSIQNPQRQLIAIQYYLSKGCDVRIDIYNALGGKIETITKKNESPDLHLLTWNGASTPSGVYFVKFEAGDFAEVQKVVLLR
ncbi:MAG: T9SS type A sorting domain-containing protein [bacterium]